MSRFHYSSCIDAPKFIRVYVDVATERWLNTTERIGLLCWFYNYVVIKNYDISFVNNNPQAVMIENLNFSHK